MDTEMARQSLDGLSEDTDININDDIALESEFSGDSRQKQSESIFSSLRTSIDGNPGYINYFNILKQGTGQEDEPSFNSSSILGPNSIFDLTQALDAARVKLNKALRSQVTVNGGTQTVYNLIKPSTKDIPPIKLQPLKEKVAFDVFTRQLIDGVSEEYGSFELSYNPLTADILSTFSELYKNIDKSISQAGTTDDNESLEIPEIFEDPHFRLDDPRIFRRVMQQSKILQDSEFPDTTQLVHNTEVQENLLKYLDYVEMQLISEISKTSDSFFTTLGDIKSIKTQSKACVQKLETIKLKLNLLENSQSKAGLEVLNTLDESRSVNHLETSLLQLKAVLKEIDKAKKCFTEKNNIECLETITRTENLIDGIEYENHFEGETMSPHTSYKYPLIKLRGLPALRSSILTLRELKHACSRGYIDEFLSLLVEDLRTHYKSVSPKETINRMYATSYRAREYNQPSTNMSFMKIEAETKKALHLFIQNLIKSGCLVEAFAEYRARIVSEVKAIIRHGLPTENNPLFNNRSQFAMEASASSNNSEADISLSQETKQSVRGSDVQRGTLSENIKTLSNSAFSRMIKAIYSHLSECLRRLTIHQKLLLDLSLTSLPINKSEDVDVMSLDITDSINKAIEITQVRLVKVLNVRLEQLGDLPIDEYLSLFLISSTYLLECESINPGFNMSELGRSLNEWIKNHVGYFIHRFHSNSVKQLASICDKETWKEFTGPELVNSQEVVDKVISYSEFVRTGEGFDGTEWTKKMLDIYEDETSSGSSLSKKPTLQSSITKIRVKENSYYVPQLITNVVETTGDYVILSKMFGPKASSIMQNLLNYLKVLNSRVSLAILNAGATRTAGLKHITTKHLALCIQTVDFLRVYSEAIDEIFKLIAEKQEKIQDGLDQSTFATSIKHFEDHKNELVNKLVSIMHDRTLSHCNAIKSLDLSKSGDRSQQCRPYMETLVKETLTVSKVIGKYLSLVDCQLIMLQIFDNYKKILVNCFCAELPQLKDFNEKHSILKDVDFFRVKLGEIQGYGNSGQVIWENVNSLPTIEDTKMEEKMRQNAETSPKPEVERINDESADSGAKNSNGSESDTKLNHEPLSIETEVLADNASPDERKDNTNG
ncbi:Vps54-domain-containing protein [Metschnikowia bicuspidata var. bicuspidata NRRL YB-4993]|uniref:Vps54-domain-containing protein n=1 Tax=Metschnikowia bicuspidata var. bicuspidata NRRL YB-4993 TaxID=869754 RepID=A0A1A0H7Y5_9ASCO|nr:Vps54-domain-containing protein [Metschnikowia bicuspidata var. bicuspidata NRRL YB-4993]OBA20095.1 Vps54-domain-containing protein [Metschnikowia bicuspidata var. bicuspidata NRRL YB-4993]